MMPGGILHRRDCACGVAVAGNGRAVEMLMVNRGEVKRSRTLQGCPGGKPNSKRTRTLLRPCLVRAQACLVLLLFRLQNNN
jgi:hypothetical protein